MSKQEADDCRKIEIWWLLRDMSTGDYRDKTISWGRNGDNGSVGCEINLLSEEPYVRFHYIQTDRYTGDKKNFDYKVPLTTTPCHIGGSRYWFKCSLFKSGVYCGRRVGVLYKDGDWFGCRHCYSLTYSSRKVSRSYRYYPLFRVLEIDSDIEKLEQKTKRRTYKGQLTKKQAKLQKLYRKASFYYQAMKGRNFK